jgi:hypothetical protein
VSEPTQNRVRVEGSRTRCPYCHDDVQTDESTWVACAGCLARHHGACWEESGCCSACGAEDRLARIAGETAARLTPLAAEDERHADSNVALGGPPRIGLGRFFEGEATIEDAAWLQATVRRAIKVNGRVALEGRSMVWRPHGETGCKSTTLTVSLTSKAGKTELRFDEDLRGYFALFVLALGAIFMTATLPAVVGGLATVGLPFLSTVLLPLLAVGHFLVARAVFKNYAQRREAKLNGLMEQLSDGLAWSPASPTPERSATLKQPLKKE